MKEQTDFSIKYLLILYAIVLWGIIIILIPLKIIGVDQSLMNFTALAASLLLSVYVVIKKYPTKVIEYLKLGYET